MPSMFYSFILEVRPFDREMQQILLTLHPHTLLELLILLKGYFPQREWTSSRVLKLFTDNASSSGLGCEFIIFCKGVGGIDVFTNGMLFG